MSLALKWGEDGDSNSGLLLFDAVTIYTQNYRGKTTSHPISSGGLISDHFIKDNPTITVGCVITGVDISTGSYTITDLDGDTPLNVRQAPTAVSVNSTDSSVLQKYIPDSIGQFLSSSSPEVIVDNKRADLIEQIKSLLIVLATGSQYDDVIVSTEDTIQLVKIYEFQDNVIRKIINRLVIVDVNFKEDANTGYALYCDIKFEQVRFASLKKTNIPKDVTNSLRKKVASKTDKGKQDSTPGSVGATGGPADVDPERAAVKATTQ